MKYKLDLVCSKRAVSNSRPARRKDFFLFTCRNWRNWPCKHTHQTWSL